MCLCFCCTGMGGVGGGGKWVSGLGHGLGGWDSVMSV